MRFAKREMKKALGKYVDPEKVDLDASPLEDRKKREVEYVIIAVRDDNVERQASLIGAIAEKAAQTSAMLLGPDSSIMTLVWGAAAGSAPEAAERNRFLDSLRDLGEDVRALSGVVTALIGNVGSSSRMSFTALIPSYATVVRRLLDLRPGQIDGVGG